MGQKRKRQALSCVDCRRRKVKCDRTYPVCDRCQKAGNAEKCTYVPHTGLEDGLPTPSEDSPRQHHATRPQIAPSGEPCGLAAIREISPNLEIQSRQPLPQPDDGLMRTLFGRAAQMETFPRAPGAKPSNVTLFSELKERSNRNSDHQPNPASDFSKVLVRGKAFGTHYYGPSFAISMLLQFEELSKFVKGMLNEVPSLSGFKEKMAATRAASKKSKHKSTVSDDIELQAMIPERSVTDGHVARYLDTFETTYRILHVPTFKRDYEAYWADPASAKMDFLVTLLLVLACVYTIAPEEPPAFVGRSAARREVVIRWIDRCEAWLEEQSQKHVTLAHFQGHILVFLARCINCIKIKREWTASGKLHRFAMAVGMHREPCLLSKKIDVFDQEMRRRLWFTILELDLATTTARGFPPTIDSFSWDCAPPRNIDDEDFDQNSTELPPPKARSVFTRTSFLHIACESLPLRVEVLGRINSVRLGLDLEAVLQYDKKFRVIIDDIPTWKNSMPIAFAQNLAYLLLYDYILILHIPFASQTQDKARSFYSVASKRDISFKTLQIYTKMSLTDRLVYCDIRDDACRASLALTHDMVLNMNRDVVPNHDQVLALLDNVVETLGMRFSHLGQGFHTFWITLSSYYLLKSKVSPGQASEVFSQEAASRVIGVFENVINNQVSMPLQDGTLITEEPWNPSTMSSMDESLGSYSGAFSGFDQLNFFDDPLADINFDVGSIWNVDAFNL